MPTVAELQDALVNADRAGDTAAAQQLADALYAAQQTPAAPAPKFKPQESDSFAGDLKNSALNLIGGGLRGAGSIGATAMRVLPNALGGDTAEENAQRRDDMDMALNQLGADPESWGFKGGKLAAEIAGTAGAGGAMAKPVQALANVGGLPPRAIQAMQGLAESLGAGGFKAAGLKGAQGALTRIAGGGAAGGAQAAMVDPNDAGAGALVGGALPGGAMVAGKIGKGLGGAANLAYQVGRGVIRPATERGQQEIAGEILRASATDFDKALGNMRSAKPIVPGSAPTMGQVAGDPGLAQLERTLYNNPLTQGALARSYGAQQDARNAVISEIAGAPGYRDLVAQGRKAFANEDYGRAVTEGLDPAAVKEMAPQIASLLGRPSMREARKAAVGLARENDIKLSKFGSMDGLIWLGKGLDNVISEASKPTSSVGKDKLRALLQTKDDFTRTVEQLSPAYREAQSNYAAMSKNINAMDAAQMLKDKLYKDARWGGEKEMGSAYQDALGATLESIKKSTGMDLPLDAVMPTRDVASLEAIAQDLARKSSLQTSGRAGGSPTMQNMMGQNLINKVATTLGTKPGFANTALTHVVGWPASMALRYGKPEVEQLLAEAAADPAKAVRLAEIVANSPTLGSDLRKLAPNVPRPLANLIARLAPSSEAAKNNVKGLALGAPVPYLAQD